MRVVVRSGVCLYCGLRVPVTRAGFCARHWLRYVERISADGVRIMSVRRVHCEGSKQSASLIINYVQDQKCQTF